MIKIKLKLSLPLPLPVSRKKLFFFLCARITLFKSWILFGLPLHNIFTCCIQKAANCKRTKKKKCQSTPWVIAVPAIQRDTFKLQASRNLRPINLSKTTTSIKAHFNTPPVAVTVADRGIFCNNAFSPK